MGDETVQDRLANHNKTVAKKHKSKKQTLEAKIFM